MKKVLILLSILFITLTSCEKAENPLIFLDPQLEVVALPLGTKTVPTFKISLKLNPYSPTSDLIFENDIKVHVEGRLKISQVAVKTDTDCLMIQGDPIFGKYTYLTFEGNNFFSITYPDFTPWINAYGIIDRGVGSSLTTDSFIPGDEITFSSELLKVVIIVNGVKYNYDMTYIETFVLE